MRFDPAPRRAVSENLLPMINVVFLLLIFFLIAAKLAPPEPFELTPPEAAGAPVAELPEGVLYLAPGGLVGWGKRGARPLGTRWRQCGPAVPQTATPPLSCVPTRGLRARSLPPRWPACARSAWTGSAL